MHIRFPLIIAIACAFASRAFADSPILARPGDTGEFDVAEVNSQNGGTESGVQLQITLPPGISTISTSNSGPIDIPAGQTGNLNFTFAVATNAVTGLYKILATIISSSPIVSLDNPTGKFYSTLAVQADNVAPIAEPSIFSSSATSSDGISWAVNIAAVALDSAGIQAIQFWQPTSQQLPPSEFEIIIATFTGGGATGFVANYLKNYTVDPNNYSKITLDTFALKAIDMSGNDSGAPNTLFGITAQPGSAGMFLGDVLSTAPVPVALTTTSAVVDQKNMNDGVLGSVVVPGGTGNVGFAYRPGSFPGAEGPVPTGGDPLPYATIDFKMKTWDDSGAVDTFNLGTQQVFILNGGGDAAPSLSYAAFTGAGVGHAIRRFYTITMNLSYGGGQLFNAVTYTCDDPNYVVGFACPGPLTPHYHYLTIGTDIFTPYMSAGANTSEISMYAALNNTPGGQQVSIFQSENTLSPSVAPQPNVKFENVTQAGYTRVEVVGNDGSSFLNNGTAPAGQGFQLWTSAQVDGQVTLTIKYPAYLPPTVTPSQEVGLKVMGSGGTADPSSVVDTTNRTITATFNFSGTGDIGTFAIAVPSDTSKPGAVQNFSAQQQLDNSFSLNFQASGADGQSGQNDVFNLNILQNGNLYQTATLQSSPVGQYQTYNTGPLPVGVYQFTVSGQNLTGTTGPSVSQSGSISGSFGGGPPAPNGNLEASLNATQAVNVLPMLSQDPVYKTVLNALQTAGKISMTNAYQLSSPAGSLQAPATLTFNFPPLYDPYNQQNFSVYVASADGTLSRPVQTVNLSAHTATLQIAASSGIYVMAFDGPPSMNDVTPPVTTISFSPSSTGTSSGIELSSATFISLTGQDYSTMTAVAAGYAGAYYWLDVPTDSTGTTIPTAYVSTFTLAAGTHTLTYFGADNNGNLEIPTQLNLNVTTSLLPAGRGGLGLGLDGADLLWSIAFDSGAVVMAHNDANGVITASATLPGADSAFPWNVFFDTSGSAYAVGATIGANGADQLAVYHASPRGDAIISSQTFDSGFNNNNLVFGVAAPGWIVGAVQTQGPIGAGQAGTRGYSSAIWRFNPASGLIQLTTTYSRAGMDIATGLAVDGGGNLWVSGFSYSPNPRSPRPLDLFLSKYAPDGRTLLAGPFIREGYLATFDTSLLARVAVSSGTVYVAAPRGRAAGGTDMALIAFNAANGQVTSENAWRPADLTSVYPSTLLQDAMGNLLTAGSFGFSDGTLAGLWRYAAGGTLSSVAQLAVGGAEGVAFNGGNLWLVVDGSTSPYLDAAEAPVDGALSDIEPPRTRVVAGTPSFAGNLLYASSSTLLGFTTTDDAFIPKDGLGVGATQTFYAVDAFTYSSFASSFSMVAEGTHTINFFSLDLEGNAEVAKSTTVAIDLTAPTVTLISSGSLYAVSALDPVVRGVASGVAQINYLVDVVPNNCHNQGQTDPTAPAGSCLNEAYAGPFALTVGTHTVYMNAVDNVGNGFKVISSSFVVVASSGLASFSTYQLNPSTGAIGIPFAITGPGGFGTYAGAATEVLIGGATAPVSVWNDTSISGTIPKLSTGIYPVFVQIQGASSATALSLGFFSVLPLSVSSLSASSGPIGIPFTVSGSAFGPYAGAQTQFLFDGKPAPLALWNDTTISGTIPNLSSGTHAAWAERLTADGGVSVSATSFFTVTVPMISSIVPSSGPIDAMFTLNGQSFGPYAGSLTQVLFGGATVPLSVWNDTNITGIVPGALAAGTYHVKVERLTSDGGVVLSTSADYQVVTPNGSGVTPSSGPIGVPFTITGSGFGAYDGANTVVTIGGVAAALSVWNDSTISGTIPALSTGAYTVKVKRIQGGSNVTDNVATFTVTSLAIAAPTPASGPIGMPFTLTGTRFGPYDGANTQVLIGGATAALSVWNDNTISGTVPTLAAGSQPMWLQRFSGSGLQTSNTVFFQVVVPAIASISPSSGPIGIAFTLTGSGFGPYSGSNTQVLVGGATVPLSVWNDTTISGTVPGSLAAGVVHVKVERIASDGGIVLSTSANFQVVAPVISGISSSTGPIGIPFTINGSGFGAYDGGNTQILFGGVSAPLSVWNDATVSGSIPALPTGAYAVTLQRQQGIYLQSTFVSSFSVILPLANSVTPSTGPIGASFTITGSGFGPYGGANTLVLIGGATAPLSVWNDNQVSGTVPGALASSAGPTTIIVERLVGSAIASTTPLPFFVAVPTIDTMTPSFGPDGTGVSITGSGFGPYAGSATSLLLNGTTVPLAVWNDSNIVWTVPAGFPDGTYPVVVVRSPSDGGSITSASATFTVGTSMGTSAFFAAATPLAAHPDWYFAGGMNLPATQDNRIQTPSLAAVTVSSGSLSKDTIVTVANARALYAAERAVALARGGLSAAGEAISFGPDGMQFAHPVTIQLPYDANLVPADLAGKLAINYYDPAAKTWTPLETTVDLARHLLSAKTSHFSLYQPLGVGIGVASAAQDAFGLRAAYVFPNPVRGANLVTIRIQPGLADSVEVHVYDSTGRRVHSSSAFTFSLTNDLNGLGAQDTFDHVWDVSGVGSGVYSYVITAKKAGAADIHATGKIGVIK